MTEFLLHGGSRKIPHHGMVLLGLALGVFATGAAAAFKWLIDHRGAGDHEEPV